MVKRYFYDFSRVFVVGLKSGSDFFIGVWKKMSRASDLLIIPLAIFGIIALMVLTGFIVISVFQKKIMSVSSTAQVFGLSDVVNEERVLGTIWTKLTNDSGRVKYQGETNSGDLCIVDYNDGQQTITMISHGVSWSISINSDGVRVATNYKNPRVNLYEGITTTLLGMSSVLHTECLRYIVFMPKGQEGFYRELSTSSPVFIPIIE